MAPTVPPRKATGTKAAMVISVEEQTEVATSRTPS